MEITKIILLAIGSLFYILLMVFPVMVGFLIIVAPASLMVEGHKINYLLFLIIWALVFNVGK